MCQACIPQPIPDFTTGDCTGFSGPQVEWPPPIEINEAAFVKLANTGVFGW